MLYDEGWARNYMMNQVPENKHTEALHLGKGIGDNSSTTMASHPMGNLLKGLITPSGLNGLMDAEAVPTSLSCEVTTAYISTLSTLSWTTQAPGSASSPSNLEKAALTAASHVLFAARR